MTDVRSNCHAVTEHTASHSLTDSGIRSCDVLHKECRHTHMLLLQAGPPGGDCCAARGQLGLRQLPHLRQRDLHGLKTSTAGLTHMNNSRVTPCHTNARTADACTGCDCDSGECPESFGLLIKVRVQQLPHLLALDELGCADAVREERSARL